MVKRTQTIRRQIASVSIVQKLLNWLSPQIYLVYY